MSNLIKNRIVGQEEVNPEDLLAHPFNWRVHPKEQQKALQGSLDQIGWVKQIIVNKKTNRVIDGHLRVNLALRNNESKVPVVYIDVSEDEEKIILASLDPLVSLGVADEDMLQDLIKDVEIENGYLNKIIDDAIKRASKFSLTPQPKDEKIKPEKIHIENQHQKEMYDKFFDYLSGEYPLLDTKIKKLIAFIEENKFCEL